MLAVRPVSVRTLLGMGVLGDARVLCGLEGLDREVTHVTIAGAPQMEPWIRENELVMTTGFPLRDKRSGITEMVRTLVRIRAAALVFKDGLYLPSMLVPEAIRIAEKASFPIIRVPRDTAWADVIEAIYVLLLRGSGNAANRGHLAARLGDSPAVSFYRDMISRECEAPQEGDRSGRAFSAVIKEHESYSPFVVRAKDRESAQNAAGILQASLLEHSLDAVAFAYDQDVIVIWPSDQGPLDQPVNRRRANVLIASLVSGGARDLLPVASPTVGVILPEVRQAVIAARETLRGIGNLKGKQEIVWYPESSLAELLLSSMSSSRVLEFCNRCIGPLIEHDREKGGDFLRTLETYLEHDCSVNSAAEVLFIHPSTLKQRLKKMEKLLEIQRLGQNFQLKAELYFALKMYRMIRVD